MVIISKVVNNTRYAVFRAYKQLLKVQRETFNEDTYTIKEAKRKTREEFLKNKDEIDTNKIQECINQANDVASLLQKNVAQAEIENPSEHIFKIKLHERHELGDNKSIKNPPSKTLKRQMVGNCARDLPRTRIFISHDHISSLQFVSKMTQHSTDSLNLAHDLINISKTGEFADVVIRVGEDRAWHQTKKDNMILLSKPNIQPRAFIGRNDLSRIRRLIFTKDDEILVKFSELLNPERAACLSIIISNMYNNLESIGLCEFNLLLRGSRDGMTVNSFTSRCCDEIWARKLNEKSFIFQYHDFEFEKSLSNGLPSWTKDYNILNINFGIGFDYIVIKGWKMNNFYELDEIEIFQVNRRNSLTQATDKVRETQHNPIFLVIDSNAKQQRKDNEK
ncbi:3496_t:CDS:10, partial [Funneliformis geosporum]